MKKCETLLAGSLEGLTSCLCDHPTGGSEDVYNKFKTMLDETLSIKRASEKAETLAKEAISAFNDKIDEELEQELDKLSKDEQKTKKPDAPKDANTDNGNAKSANGIGEADNTNGAAV